MRAGNVHGRAQRPHGLRQLPVCGIQPEVGVFVTTDGDTQVQTAVRLVQEELGSDVFPPTISGM